MHRIVFALLLNLIFLPAFSHAEELNAGFVQGLWYGSETVIANEPTRIYVALRNNTQNDLTGTVRFSDNGTRIGVSYVSALPGRLVEAWVDWKPQYGEHTITATLSDVRVYEIGQTPETGEVEDTIAQDTLYVDFDTDKDGIPNKTDTDDDNDTVSDKDEEARKTDPLKADPIAKDEDDDSKTEREEESERNEETKKTRDEPENQSGPGPLGLERYVPNPTVKNAFETVTDTINKAKTSVDEYRDTRNDVLRGYFDGSKATSSTPGSDLGATITRTKIENEESFFTAVIEGGKAFVSGVYSFLLWILSKALTYPAILELLLLLFIILFVYRTARKLGRRRGSNDRS